MLNDVRHQVLEIRKFQKTEWQKYCSNAIIFNSISPRSDSL